MSKTGRPASTQQRARDKALFVILLVLLGGLAACAVIAPDLLKILFYVLVVSLFCEDVNSIGGTCRTSAASKLFGWTVVIAAAALVVLGVRTLYRAWKRL